MGLISSPQIAFVTEKPVAYQQAMASTRLRVYDVIKSLKKHKAELYDDNSDYKLIIFQKAFSEEFLVKAEKLKKQDKTVILDINVDYVNVEEGEDHRVTMTQRENMKEMLSLCDHVITSSLHLRDIYAQHHPSVFMIEEIVTKHFFKKKKKYPEQSHVKILYTGYAEKAKELYLIADILKELEKKYPVSLLCISEKNPKLGILKHEDFIRYDQKKLPAQLLEGDIKVAPRDLKNRYNLGHSFTKLAYPMAVGIPAVASPVPSYINRPVLLCQNEEEWYRNLEALIVIPGLRKFHGEKGRAFVQANFSSKTIGNQYDNLFGYLLNQ